MEGVIVDEMDTLDRLDIGDRLESVSIGVLKLDPNRSSPRLVGLLVR